ncbi:hypothetical protein [Sphingomonas sp.]|jgi:hypothetical protein|uniref:hypothetical protein n=1 Tax=Sphingomonas sp. TaxID=28214 RepID=UPI002E145B53|nr:hypothetical protein [Sphingomonas sp.]
MARPDVDQIRALAAQALKNRGRAADAAIVSSGGGDDFPEVEVARLALTASHADRLRLELALRFYAEAEHWDSDVPDASLAVFDRGEVARAALQGRDQLGSHRD